MTDTTAATSPNLPDGRLEEMTPREVIEYFHLTDEIKLDDDLGTTWGRVIAALIVVVVFSFLVFPLGARLVSVISGSGYAHFLGGLALWLAAMALTIPNLIVSVPEITGLVTIDLFRNGTLRAYGTGFQVKYLWEQAKVSNYINLRLVPTRITFTFVSKDGVKVQYTCTIQYRGRLQLLPIYIRVDKADIDEALGAIVRSVVTQKVVGKDADQLRTSTQVLALQKALEKTLGQGSGGHGHEIEYRYGIDIEVVSLSEPTFSDDYIEATTTQVVVDKINAAGRKLMDKDTGLGLTGQSAADLAAMLNKEGITKHVTGIEASDLADKLGGAVASAATAIAGAFTGRQAKRRTKR